MLPVAFEEIEAKEEADECLGNADLDSEGQ